jgi:hypothetical protein
MEGNVMNVYDMGSESGEAGDNWVRFYTRHKLGFPHLTVDEPAFFAAHPRIEVMRNNHNIPRGTKQQLGDYSNVNHNVHPVFSERAKQVFAPHLQGLGRWIELVPDCDPTYWLFSITNVIDAMDEEKSEVKRFADGGVMRIVRFVFKPEAVRDQWLFTLPQRPGSNRCVTDRFVELARQHGLTGLEFKLLWSSSQAQPAARAA